jgi:hypothetical protein
VADGSTIFTIGGVLLDLTLVIIELERMSVRRRNNGMA